MARQPWWPENPYPEYSIGDVRGYRTCFEEGCEAMFAAWWKKLEAVYEGPLPGSEYYDDPIGLLDWVMVQLEKELSDA